MLDIMVDLETADNVRSASIFTCGVVQCDLTTGELGRQFHRAIELQDCIDHELTISADTLYWWLRQSDAARNSLNMQDKLLITEFCDSLNEFIQLCAKDLNISPTKFRLWGNGKEFDIAILRHAFRAIRKELVVPFWQDRDVRTVVGFYPENLFYKWKQDTVRLESHNALADSKYQVEYVSHIMKELGVEKLY